MANDENEASALAELLMKVSRRVDAAANASDLSSAQWAALRYLFRTAASARTNRAFAAYHQTTTGTVAVTFKNLVDKGLIERSQSLSDRRQAQFNLTDEGNKMLESDPFCVLVRAIQSLDESDRTALTQGVSELVLAMSHA